MKKLNYSDYNFIKKSLINYIKGNDLILNNNLLKYINMPEFVQQKKYILYRGTILPNIENFVKNNLFFDKTKLSISFTTNINIANRFALNGLRSNEYGLLLKRKFLPNEILFDIDYIVNNHPILYNFIDSKENEVIVFPKNMNLEIIKIYK